jgi:pyruvate/2-oxoglutarate/acetoin dehydrogenase E1 component
MDPLVNQAAKLRYMSGGQYSLPMVVRTPGGAGLGMAAQHSQSLEALLSGMPGLLILAPATPYDAKGLLKSAVRSNNPVLFFENKLGYTATGIVPSDPYLVPIGRADIKRRGRDVTVVSIGAVLSRVVEAATELAGRGIDVEVVDLRTIVPWDQETVLASVVRTGRLITVEDAPLRHGFGSEIVAAVVERAHPALRAAPLRVAAVDVPLAYDSGLENLALPSVERIADAITRVAKH